MCIDGVEPGRSDPDVGEACTNVDVGHAAGWLDGGQASTAIHSKLRACTHAHTTQERGEHEEGRSLKLLEQAEDGTADLWRSQRSTRDAHTPTQKNLVAAAAATYTQSASSSDDTACNEVALNTAYTRTQTPLRAHTRTHVQARDCCRRDGVRCRVG